MIHLDVSHVLRIGDSNIFQKHSGQVGFIVSDFLGEIVQITGIAYVVFNIDENITKKLAATGEGILLGIVNFQIEQRAQCIQKTLYGSDVIFFLHLNKHIAVQGGNVMQKYRTQLVF